MEKELTVEEVLKKEVFKVQDIMTLFQVGICKAYKIMNAIKAYRDTLEVVGRVHKNDYLAYVNRYAK